MAIGSWVVSAVIRFSSNGVATMRGLAVEAGRMNTVIDGQTSKIQRATQALEGHRLKLMQVGATASGTFAVAGAAFSAYGIMGAAQLERALTSVGLATHASSPQAMQRYAALAFKTSGITAQDVNIIAGEMAMAATSGLNDPAKLTDAFTRIAKAADVLWMSPKHINPVDAVKQMSTLAHLFGVYSGAPLQHMLDRSAEMMFVQPDNLQKLVTQGRVFIGSARAAGVSEEDIFKQAMTMGQTGFLSGRGGSGIARVIEYLSGAATMTGHLSKLQHSALYDLGLTTAKGPAGVLRTQFTDHGNLLLGKVVEHLEAIRSRFTPVGFVGELQRAFLAQGGRYMATELTPSVYAKGQQNWGMMNAIGTIDGMWKKYSHNFIYQWGVFWTNLENIPKATFFPLLPDLTNRFESWAGHLSKTVQYLAANPDAAKRWGEGVLAFTGVMGGAWVVFMATMARSAIQMPIAMFRLEAALDKLTATIATDGTIIGSSGTAAAGGLGALASKLKWFVGALAEFGLVAGIGYNIYKDLKAGRPKGYHTTPDSVPRSDLVPFGWLFPGGGKPIPHALRQKTSERVSGGASVVNHFGGANLVFPNVKSKDDVIDLFNNPRSALFTSAPGTRTHANIPFSTTVPPRQ